MKEISPLGWVLIGAITFIVLSSYWSLASMFRNKGKKSQLPSWSKTWHILTNPWEAETRDLERLSKEVSTLGKSGTTGEKTNLPPG